MKVPEGLVRVKATGAGLEIPEFSQRIETEVWIRPFLSPTFVINPDRCAVLVHQEITYSTSGVPSPPPTLRVAERFHTFEGIDYEFSQAPTTLRLEGGSAVERESLNLSEFRDPQERLLLVRAFQGEVVTRKWLETYLEADPEQADLLYTYTGMVSKEDSLKFVRARLGDRPVRVTWHRIYQDLSGGAGAGELVPEYRELLAEAPDNDRRYLLARVLLDDVEIKALNDASLEGATPSAYGLMVKGFKDLAQARHEAALEKFEQALAIQDRYLFRYARDLALVYLRRYPELIQRTAREFGLRPHSFDLAWRLIRYQVAKGDRGGALRTSNACEKAWSPYLDMEGQTQLRASLQRVYAYCEGALPTFAQKCTEDEAFAAQVAMRRPREALTLLQKRSDAAFKKRNEAEDSTQLDNSSDGEFYSLLTVLILAKHTGDEKVEAEILERLQAQTPPAPSPEAERVVVALRDEGRALDHAALLALDAQPQEKVLLLTLLGQRFPEQRQAYYAFVRRLNVPLVFPHHLVREVIGE